VSFVDGSALEQPAEQRGAFGVVGRHGDVDRYVLV
jgi:hypothetical protein